MKNINQKSQSTRHYGVHQTHCCVLHGCKYNDDDCPVVTMKIDQDYLCEQCDHYDIKSVQEAKTIAISGVEGLVGSETVFVAVFIERPFSIGDTKYSSAVADVILSHQGEQRDNFENRVKDHQKTLKSLHTQVVYVIEERVRYVGYSNIVNS